MEYLTQQQAYLAYGWIQEADSHYFHDKTNNYIFEDGECLYAIRINNHNIPQIAAGITLKTMDDIMSLMALYPIEEPENLDKLSETC